MVLYVDGRKVITNNLSICPKVIIYPKITTPKPLSLPLPQALRWRQFYVGFPEYSTASALAIQLMGVPLVKGCGSGYPLKTFVD